MRSTDRRETPSVVDIERSLGSFAYFLSHLVYLRDRGGTKFEPWGWQEELAEALPDFKRTIVLKGRQLGISWMLAAYALHTAFEPGAEVLLLSQTERDAKKLLSKVRFIWRRLPAALTSRFRVGRYNQSVIEFEDRESLIEALPSTEDAGRGSTARLVVCDEHAFHAWAEENMAAVDPTIESGGQLLSVSTANGIGNLFASQWAKATTSRRPLEPEQTGAERHFGTRLKEASAATPEGAWLPIFLPYDCRPGRTPEWWGQKLETFTQQWKIHQEYPRDPEEAFVQTGRPRFSRDYLDTHKKLTREPLSPELWPQALRDAGFRPDELRVFSLPVPRHRHVAGADVAEGLEHGDYSDLSVLDRDAESGRPTEVLSLHGHWEPDEFGKLIDVIARVYGGTYGIERNNHGLTVIVTCRNLGTPGLYRERPVLNAQGQEIEEGKLGWLTTGVTKPLMIDGLEQALRTFGIELRDALAFPELMFYQTLANGKTGAPAGQWDDRVTSRAIAIQMLAAPPTNSKTLPINPITMTSGSNNSPGRAPAGRGPWPSR